MVMARIRQTKFRQRLPSEICVDLPLVLHNGQLAALAQRAGSEEQTIGQIIRSAINVHLAGHCERCHVDSDLRNIQIEASPDGSGIVEVMLLLTAARLAEVVAIARQRGTTSGTLVQRMVSCTLLESAARPRA
jgi:hypothetical protein